MLQKTGFLKRPGRGSHTKWLHPLYPGHVMLSGKDGDDAKAYQEKEVKKAIRIVTEQEGKK